MNERQKRIEEAMQRYFESQAETAEGKHARQRQLLRRKHNWKRGSSEPERYS